MSREPDLTKPPVTPPAAPTDAEIRRRQRSRAIFMGLLLAAFVILLYAVTIAKISLL